MNMKLHALCWAIAIVGIALAGAYGLIDRQLANTLTITLPAVAWMAITGRLGCRRRTS